MSTPRPLLILASQSPRRKKILSFLSVAFRIVKAKGFDETAFPNEKAPHLVKRLALGKADWVSQRHPNFPVMSADTVVVHKGEIFGKPRNYQEALRMLMLLQGTRHEVWTATALIWKKNRIKKSHVQKTLVFFESLSPNEVDQYLKSEEPYDKAGAYDIQGTALNWIKRWEGDYFNVMGLPIQWTVQQIKMINYLSKS